MGRRSKLLLLQSALHNSRASAGPRIAGLLRHGGVIVIGNFLVTYPVVLVAFDATRCTTG